MMGDSLFSGNDELKIKDYLKHLGYFIPEWIRSFDNDFIHDNGKHHRSWIDRAERSLLSERKIGQVKAVIVDDLRPF